jgi:membrane protein DedA with SNARE-associated domain
LSETASDPLEARRARILWWCAIPIGVTTIVNLIGTAASPYLLARHPLTLIGCSPLFRHLVVVAPRVDLVSFFAVAVPRHFLPDPFFYMLGREYGHVAMEWADGNSPFTGRIVRALERVVGKLGPVALLLSPDVIVSTLVGVARVPFPLFVLFNIAGTFGTVFVARWFGDLLEKQIDTMVRFFEGHLALVTVVSLLLVVLFNWYARRGTGPVPAAKDEGVEP